MIHGERGEPGRGGARAIGRWVGAVAIAVAVTAGPLSRAPAHAEEAPYDDTLARLAEVLGALHHLRPLCGAPEAQLWREQMLAILEAEQASPQRRQRFVDRFNLSWRGFVAVHRTCTPAARELAERYKAEGETLGRDLLTRWGRP